MKETLQQIMILETHEMKQILVECENCWYNVLVQMYLMKELNQ
jgi:hypothetical protein